MTENKRRQDGSHNLACYVQQELRFYKKQRRPRTAEKTRFFLVLGRGRPLTRPPERLFTFAT